MDPVDREVQPLPDQKVASHSPAAKAKLGNTKLARSSMIAQALVLEWLRIGVGKDGDEDTEYNLRTGILSVLIDRMWPAAFADTSTSVPEMQTSRNDRLCG